MKTETGKYIESFDFYQAADGSVSLTKLGWIIGDGERRCLGPVAPGDVDLDSWIDALTTESIAAQDMDHEKCQPENPFGMCESCERDYNARLDRIQKEIRNEFWQRKEPAHGD